MVERLKKKGAITVESIEEIPIGSTVVFSAHGSPPDHYKKAREKNLRIIDATCPLVTKVHLEVHRFAKRGFEIIYIGHKGHVEANGVRGELPEKIHLVETIDDVKKLNIKNTDKLVYLSQTTLSITDTKEVIKAIKEKFPNIDAPAAEDICYATTNRQRAIKELAKKVDAILVIGSPTSSNSKRLVESAKEEGTKAYLIEEVQELNPDWINNSKIVGISAGASAPEDKVQEVVKFFTKNGAVKEDLKLLEENLTFAPPEELITLKDDQKRLS